MTELVKRPTRIRTNPYGPLVYPFPLSDQDIYEHPPKEAVKLDFSNPEHIGAFVVFCGNLGAANRQISFMQDVTYANGRCFCTTLIRDQGTFLTNFNGVMDDTARLQMTKIVNDHFRSIVVDRMYPLTEFWKKAVCVQFKKMFPGFPEVDLTHEQRIDIIVWNIIVRLFQEVGRRGMISAFERLFNISLKDAEKHVRELPESRELFENHLRVITDHDRKYI